MSTISRFHITQEKLCMILFAFILLSRASITTEFNYVPLNTTAVQTFYSLSMLGLYVSKKISTKKIGTMHWSTALSALLIIYIILFGAIFVNPPLAQYTNGILLRQMLFLMIVFSTVSVTVAYRLFDKMLLTAFYTFSFILFFQFATHITDLGLLNPLTVFSDSSRVRVDYGFSHYNALGAFCACHIIIWMILKARHLIPFKHNILNVIVLLISVLMLLGSASRNAISSLIVYAICYGFMSLKETPNRRYFKLLLECLLLLFLFVFFVAGASNIPLTDLLNQSNRETLFEVALPTFFSSTRTMIGLGLASNEIYGMNLTPYPTYWLDNSYVYVLVTTGFIGIILYILMILVLFIGLRHVQLRAMRKHTISLTIMCLYSALFETTLFWAGVMQNYVYLLILLVAISGYFNNQYSNIFSKSIKETI